MTDKRNLLLLFEHPTEPVFMDKGGNGTMFQVPDSYVTNRYNSICKKIQGRVSVGEKNHISVKEIPVPDISYPMTLGRSDEFSLFLKSHRQKAAHLIEIFTKMPSVEDLQSVAVYARDRVNPVMFNYALSVALLHRPDTKDLDLPSFSQTFPDRFIDSKVLRNMREESFVVQGLEARIPTVISVNYTASDLEVEHRLWYFREDLGVNLHHWHWHLVYPIEANDRSIVDKDRRGELFYYMHQQIVARYNAERLSNHMARVQAFNNLDEPIAEGYFPKMNSLVASRDYPPRFDNTRLRDIDRPVNELKVGIDDMKRWRDRIYEAIHQGYVLDMNNERVILDDVKGIDILGNIIEASELTINSKLYGDLHNKGHMLIAFSHDPSNKHLESAGVMGDSSTAMRDPVFYKWHAFIDNLFQEHKRLLPAYTEEYLSFPGIRVQSINVESQGQTNRLTTFWQESDVDMSRGLDFLPRGNVFARFTHLQHNPFTYTIDVENSSKDTRNGYVRIFLAPKLDDRNGIMSLAEQRLMMVELDKFVVTMTPGTNTFTRNSTESSVTIPFERTFRNLDSNTAPENSTEELINFFCGCGWPNHMLVPKGRPEGLSFELFVMISNYDDDRVNDQALECGCSDAASYCGLRDRLYPDRKSMGYPFDREPRRGAEFLENFLTPNMSTVEVTITHDNRIEKLPEVVNSC
ncbi:phenoloxidase 3 isoform X2 [Drosophila eugracilis]|uniref:phenoloxidase 3 isoform X2 n=1 Tax=Drosophila eugracilis TaxID=29029 RepID=UPI001BD9D1F5|nr:phenoloxidase 3 isoform X2 [Drosophila eugracilis]